MGRRTSQGGRVGLAVELTARGASTHAIQLPAGRPGAGPVRPRAAASKTASRSAPRLPQRQHRRRASWESARGRARNHGRGRSSPYPVRGLPPLSAIALAATRGASCDGRVRRTERCGWPGLRGTLGPSARDATASAPGTGNVSRLIGRRSRCSAFLTSLGPFRIAFLLPDCPGASCCGFWWDRARSGQRRARGRRGRVPCTARRPAGDGRPSDRAGVLAGHRRTAAARRRAQAPPFSAADLAAPAAGASRPTRSPPSGATSTQ